MDQAMLQVWVIDCFRSDAEVCTRCLSSAEIERADRYVRLDDRRRFTVTRAALRTILGALLLRETYEIAFAVNSNGKPFLPNSDLQFNVTHSGRYGAVAVGRTPVGIDVEWIDARVDLLTSIGMTCFSPEELSLLRCASSNERSRRAYALWTRKEAVVKALGIGIGVPLAAFNAASLDNVVRLGGIFGEDVSCAIAEFEVAADHVAAFAVKLDGATRMIVPTSDPEPTPVCARLRRACFCYTYRHFACRTSVS